MKEFLLATAVEGSGQNKLPIAVIPSVKVQCSIVCM
jgi:hypothetical protein